MLLIIRKTYYSKFRPTLHLLNWRAGERVEPEEKGQKKLRDGRLCKKTLWNSQADAAMITRLCGERFGAILYPACSCGIFSSSGQSSKRTEMRREMPDSCMVMP